MDYETKILILKNYQLLQKAEIQFSNLQYKYRQYAIYWFMGVFASYGFFMSSNVFIIPLNQIFILTCISIAGSIGLTLLWSIDILIYQKLLNGVFIQELEMEAKYDFIPQIRHKMIFLTRNLAPIKIQTTFYVGIILLCLLASIFTIFYSQIKGGNIYLIYLLPFLFGVIGSLIFIMYKKSVDTHALMKFLDIKIHRP